MGRRRLVGEPASVSAPRMDGLASLQSVDRAQLSSHLAYLLLTSVQWAPGIGFEIQCDHCQARWC